MCQPMTLVLLIFLIIVFFAGVFIFFERWVKHREREWAFQLKFANNQSMSSLRISAFERLIIMLERIAPTALVMRQDLNHTHAALLQLALIKSIREEYEHNISLQIYVSESTWEKIQQAREDTIELIKTAFTKVQRDHSGADLSREIFQLEAAVGNPSLKAAIQAIRQEIGYHYR